jgi:hypothetical protein
MKIESNKIINNLFLIIVIVLLSLITGYLRDLSKIGRFQTTGDGGTILDTKTGQTYSINPKGLNLDSTFWKLIPNTKPIIKE